MTGPDQRMRMNGTIYPLRQKHITSIKVIYNNFQLILLDYISACSIVFSEKYLYTQVLYKFNDI